MVLKFVKDAKQFVPILLKKNKFESLGVFFGFFCLVTFAPITKNCQHLLLISKFGNLLFSKVRPLPLFRSCPGREEQEDEQVLHPCATPMTFIGG